ncbi:glycosyltransferase [Halobacillus massiliensis]|uniref:glycosyltransferase n=1 Tax=Halobacillus massiliensis TaxID=1926286 RepID=UPI0009E5FDA8|nr:glycosyltransferase family 2 protein [Halobacillus massiliensis]
MVLTLALIVTILLNVWTVINSFFLPSLERSKPIIHKPLVSFLIPLRNEEAQIEGLIESLKKVTYEEVEFLLLDDHSDDRTAELLKKYINSDSRFSILKGKPLPSDWNGKVHACHQLSLKAEGEYFLFLDADARVAPAIIERSLLTLWKYDASMLSGFPNYPSSSFLSHMLVPLQHMVVWLHLPLMMANYTTKPAFTAACGIFIFIKKEAYEAIGGHESVRSSLVEDVHIAREVKKHGYKMVLCNITDSVISYMYDSSKETWEGFKKNIFTGLGRSSFLAFSLMIFYFFLFLFPVILAAYGAVAGQWLFLLPFLLNVSFKMYIDVRTKHPLWLSWLLPVSIICLISIIAASMMVSLKGKSYQWKGRSYD